jgi:hypothetical protein
MADTVHNDRLAETFTRFRTEVRAEIRPPGTPAVRHTARRRRNVRIACAAAAVALVGIVAGVVTTADNRATYPKLSAAQLNELGRQALHALVKEPFSGGFQTAVTAQTQGDAFVLEPGGSPMRFVRGDDYDLVAACLGRGTVTVAWAAPGGPTGSTIVVCGGDTVRVRITPRADGPTIQIRLTPNAEAIDRAAIAVGFVEFH